MKIRYFRSAKSWQVFTFMFGAEHQYKWVNISPLLARWYLAQGVPNVTVKSTTVPWKDLLHRAGSLKQLDLFDSSKEKPYVQPIPASKAH